MPHLTKFIVTTLSLAMLLLPSCGRKTATFSQADRKAVEVAVRAVHGTDSLAALQKRMERKGNRLGSVVALRELGKALRNESRFEEALDAHMESLLQAEALDDTLEWVQALNNIGTDYRRMGVLDAAQTITTVPRSLAMSVRTHPSLRGRTGLSRSTASGTST